MKTDHAAVKLCMIGAGRHASRNIYPCFGPLANAQVTANADLALDKAQELARRHGIPASYADYREMLAHEQPDGVLICVGPEFHAAVAAELLAAGLHVYVEKPPAANCAQARTLRDAWRKSGRIHMTGFKKRFAPAYQKTKRLLEDARFGEPALLQIFRTSGKYKNQKDPRSRYLLDSGIHVVDLAQWLFGTVRRVSSFKKEPANYAINLEFLNGAVGSLALTDRMSYARGWEEVTIVGSGGVCVQVDNSVEMLAFDKDLPIAAHKPEFVAGNSHSSVEMGFQGELQAFVDAISGKEPVPSDLPSAFHTLQIIEAVEKSAEQGTPVEIHPEELP